jgi:hypothetical protein
MSSIIYSVRQILLGNRFKEDMIGRASRTYRKIRNEYKILVGKCDGLPKRRLEYNIEMDFKDAVCEVVNLSDCSMPASIGVFLWPRCRNFGISRSHCRESGFYCQTWRYRDYVGVSNNSNKLKLSIAVGYKWATNGKLCHAVTR